jgi:general stress protein 26
MRRICQFELQFLAMAEDTPSPTRVQMPAGYVPPGTKTNFLPWDWVTERLAKSHNYWICTTRPNGRPHVAPVWGVWHDGTVVFSTDPRSRKARNLAANPAVTIHLESGDEVVILEGSIERIELTSRIDDVYNEKYKMHLSTFPGPAAIYQLKPKKVMAWREKDFGSSATKWEF